MLISQRERWQAEGTAGLDITQTSSQHDWSALRDETLIALVAERREAALGAIYDRYSGLVYTIALRITGDRQTAEEVVQDVFQAVWQTAATFRPEVATFSTWLSGIARHRAIDATRSRRERSRSREFNIEGAPENSPALGTLGPENDVDQLALREAIRLALDDLPTNQRQAVELAYYGGMTRNEIADRLGEPVGTIKTRLRLAMTKLRDKLETFLD